VRTSIAVMAFGFIVEKFDLFLEFGAPALTGRTLSLAGQKFGNIAGLAFIILGTAMVGIAAARFVIAAKNIAREDLRPGTGSRIDIAIAWQAGPFGLRSIPFDTHPCNEALTDFRKRFAVLFRDEMTCILSAMQFKSV
jgi:uncharacterized membrane protein YidH (DUF202 family)